MPTSSGCAALKAAAEHAVDLLAGEFRPGPQNAQAGFPGVLATWRL
jgi:hypothetical protein